MPTTTALSFPAFREHACPSFVVLICHVYLTLNSDLITYTSRTKVAREVSDLHDLGCHRLEPIIVCHSSGRLDSSVPSNRDCHVRHIVAGTISLRL